MSTLTTNYGLVKLALTDSPPDITVMGPNWDKLDAVIGATAKVFDNTSANDSYVITVPGISAQAELLGLPLKFKATIANTTACTLNVNGYGAYAICKDISTALDTGDILAGSIVLVVWDGTRYQLMEICGIVNKTGTQTLINKTLAAPKLGSAGFIADVNGNEILKTIATVASAVNEITIKNAATGGSVGFDATGGDANIDFDITPKGTGIMKVPSGATFGTRAAGTIGVNSVTEGESNIASGIDSYAQGVGNEAKGAYSHAEGANTKAYGNYAHAEGSTNQAGGSATDSLIGEYSHAEGYGNIASNRGAHAEGYGNTASGEFSHSEGYNNASSGGASHTEGLNNTASGLYSHAEGQANQAAGSNSHTGGYGSAAVGNQSFAHGNLVNAQGADQAVFGRCNATDLTSLFIVGNGTSDATRSNVLVVDQYSLSINGTFYGGGSRIYTLNWSGYTDIRIAIQDAWSALHSGRGMGSHIITVNTSVAWYKIDIQLSDINNGSCIVQSHSLVTPIYGVKNAGVWTWKTFSLV